MNNNLKIRMNYLSGKSIIEDKYEHENSIRVSERLIRAAQIMQAWEKIGFEIKMGMEETKNYIFETPGNRLLVDDFNWIFKDYAQVVPEKYIIADESCQTDERVYKLVYSPDASEYDNEEHEYGKGHARRDYFYEMCKEISSLEGSIRILLWSNTREGRGSIGEILFKFPTEIPFRVRTLISLVFPDTALKAADKSPESSSLPAYLLKDYLIKFLSLLGSEHKEKEEIFDKESISSLGLGVRSYACLKREGITTVKQFCELTMDDLQNIRNLGRRSDAEIIKKQEELKNERPEYFNEDMYNLENSFEKPDKSESYLEKLENMVGIQDAKPQIKQIIAFAKMQKEMEASGKKSLPVTLSMEFIGNPGTAKTTTARIMAGLLSEIGLIKDGGLIEVGKSDLVAGYAGHTAIKVKEIFKRAKGKVLLIDEAYSLLECWKGAYGDEAINTIVQEMENNREDTIVIFAGYPNKMKEFFLRNPGLRSRVPFTIKFDDYSLEELKKICELEAGNKGFTIDESGKEKIEKICESAVGKADMGNGRFCRNLIEKAILSFALRTYGEGGAKNSEYILTDEDFQVSEINKKERGSIGFKVS